MVNKRLKTLGLNIKFARMKKGISYDLDSYSKGNKGISQEELAELVDTSRITISFIETGKQNPTILKIVDIARILDVDIKDLIQDV